MNQLTEANIRSLASDRSFERGYSYFRANVIDEVTRRDNLVTAEVEGSHYEPYQVQIVLHDAGIQSADCSCPYDWGGYCKHIVAVGLVLVHRDEAVESKSGLAVLLADLSETQLRQLILNVADGETAVIESIEREIGWLKPSSSTPINISVDSNAIRRKMRKAFRAATTPKEDRYDYFGYDEGLEIYSGEIFGAHLETVDALLDAGEDETAVTVVTAVIEEWIEGLTDLDEWIYEYNEDALFEDAHLLGAALAEVVLSLDLSVDSQDEWKKRITYWEEALGDMGVAKTAVEHGWEYPPLVAAMQGNITKQGAWEGNPPHFADDLALVRLNILKRQGRNQEYMNLAQAEGQHGLYVNMLAEIGQFDKAVSEAKECLGSPTQVQQLAQILVQKGKIVQALAIGDYGLGLENDHGKVELAQWLAQQAEDADDTSLALKAVQTAFISNQTLADYQAAQRLADAEWPTIKKELLKNLKRKGWSSKKIDVYLYENMLVEAMLVIDKEDYSGDLNRVLEATREKYPNWGIQKCKNRAEAIMDDGKAKYYDTAVSWLQLAHDIYFQHARQSEWDAYLNTQLDKHARKYKLVPMLKNIH